MREAVDVLEQVGLVRRSVDAAALAVHAAAARYAPSPTIAESSSSGERSLFDTADIGGDDW